MCYVQGSLEQVTRTCVMCKVYPPRLGCPHQPLAVCRNRQNHPRFDVVHFRNAELDFFNGCGYCKWARKHHSSSDSPWLNPGMPGCCRPPKPAEYVCIKSFAEWSAVNAIHGTPIPPEISRFSPPPISPTLRHQKKTVAGSSSSITPINLDKEPLIHVSTPLSTSPTDSPPRRKTTGKLPSPQLSERRAEPLSFTKSSSGKALIGLAPPVPPSQRTIVNTKHETDSTGGPKMVSNRILRNRSSLSNLSSMKPPVSTSQSTSSSSAIGSATITSDGFTDYLSDESDQELQRQAEVRAAELEIAKQEKAEFDAALRTVRHLCLQPPPEWSSPGGRDGTRVHRAGTISTFAEPQLFPLSLGHMQE